MFWNNSLSMFGFNQCCNPQVSLDIINEARFSPIGAHMIGSGVFKVPTSLQKQTS